MNRLLPFLIFGIATYCCGQVDLKRSYDLGIVAYNLNHFEDAKVILENVASQTNRYPIAFFVLGKIYKNQPYQDKGKAFEYFQKSFENSGADRGLKINSLIMMSYVIDDAGDSCLKAKQAFDIDKTNVAAQLAYATGLNKIGLKSISERKYEDAIPFLVQSQTVYPKLIEAKNNLASCYLELMERDEYSKEIYCSKVKTLLDEIDKRIPSNKKNLNYQNNVTDYGKNLSRYTTICKSDL